MDPVSVRCGRSRSRRAAQPLTGRAGYDALVARAGRRDPGHVTTACLQDPEQDGDQVPGPASTPRPVALSEDPGRPGGGDGIHAYRQGPVGDGGVHCPGPRRRRDAGDLLLGTNRAVQCSGGVRRAAASSGRQLDGKRGDGSSDEHRGLGDLGQCGDPVSAGQRLEERSSRADGESAHRHW